MAYEIDYTKFCRPAVIYFVIATIMALCTLFLSRGNFANFSSQMLSIVFCSLILMGVCNVYPEISWAIVVIFIICNVSAILMLFGRALGMGQMIPTGPYMEETQ